MRYESMSHETKSKTAAGRAGEERRGRAHHRNDSEDKSRGSMRHFLHMMKYCYFYLMTYNAANMIRSSVSNVW